MSISVNFSRSLLAPCGINCATCIACMRDKNKCPGCLIISDNKAKTRRTCKIINCGLLAGTRSKFCYECGTFPCNLVDRLDKRYRAKYRTSPVENLQSIRSMGVAGYLARERFRWICPGCGSVTSVHRNNCLSCNRELTKNFKTDQ